MIRIPLLACLLCGVVPRMHSQTPDRKLLQLRLAAETFYKHVGARRWREAARWVDTVPLDSMVRAAVQHLEQQDRAPQEELTPEFFMRGDSTMPRVVAEWYASRAKRDASRPRGPASQELLGPDFVARDRMELASLTGVAAAERWLQARDQEDMTRRMLQAQGCPMPPGGSPRRASERVLAVALEDDTTGAVMRVVMPYGGLAPEAPRQLRAVRWFWRRGQWFVGPTMSPWDDERELGSVMVSCELDDDT